MTRVVQGFADCAGAWQAVLGGPQPLADAAWLCWILFWRLTLRGAKHAMPLPALVRIVRRTAGGPLDQARAGLRQRLVSEWFARRSPMLPGNCLERSLLVHATWARAIGSTRLMVGFRSAGRTTHGHTWVTSEGELLLERADEIAGFEPACIFDAYGARLTSTP